MASSLIWSVVWIVSALFQASSVESAGPGCPPGTYGKRGGLAPCQGCSSGYYQDKPGQRDCQPCPDGHSCPDPKSSPTPCPAGKVSRYYTSQRVACEDCSSGYYQDKSGEKNCQQCPDGHSCADPAKRPVPCPAGKVSRYFTSHRSTCADCSSGYYQDKPGQKACLLCPEGHSCSDPKSSPTPCPPGKSSGHYVSQRITCAECQDGQYQDKPGQSNCLDCPLGSYCPPPKNRAIPCPAGTISQYYISQRLNCAPCPDGNYQPKIGQGRCLLCPEGRECPEPKSKSIPCPPGYQSNYNRYTSQLVKCLTCAPGYYQTIAEQSYCIICPDGYSCPQKEKGPMPCPPGFQSAYYTSQRTSCAICRPGRCMGAATPPVVCPAGMYLPPGTRLCRPCETGKYQVYAGQSSCQICPEGFYCPTTTAKPIPCPVGMYSTIHMRVARIACVACAIGTYQMHEGQNSCPYCPVGHFCAKPSLSPVPCPAGTFSSSSTTNKTTCQACSSREYQDQRGQRLCKPCPPGYFCPRADLSPQRCPPGTYSYQGLRDRGKCLSCPSGQYQDQCGQAQCKLLFADGSSPPLGSRSQCPSLNGSVLVAAEVCSGSMDERTIIRSTLSDSTSGAYSGASVQSIEGNNHALYQVVKIRPEHLPPGETVIDDCILPCTAVAFDKMATAAKKQGVTIFIRSGFRTIERQHYMYNCYKNNSTEPCNNGNKAAFPGTSNHGIGIALDLNTDCGKQYGDRPPPACATSKVYTWLKSNGHKFGFVRTVHLETWHWEFKGGPVAGPSSMT